MANIEGMDKNEISYFINKISTVYVRKVISDFNELLLRLNRLEKGYEITWEGPLEGESKDEEIVVFNINESHREQEKWEHKLIGKIILKRNSICSCIDKYIEELNHVL